ncbi:MAG: hypothetical protein ACP5PK_07870 [candidate division WOR-3 bacterium]
MNTSKIMSVIALVGIVLTAGYADWGPIRQLTVSPDNSNMPMYGRAAVSMGDFIHVVYSDVIGGDRQVVYIRSTDRGVNWTSPALLDEMSFSYTFSIAADSGGNVHFINKRASGELWYRRSTDNGATWSNAQQITAYCDVPILLTNRQQNVYIFNIRPVSPPVLEMYRSTDGGANFTRSDVISQQGFQSICAAISGSSIHFAYAYGGMGTAQTYYLRSTDNGTTWETPTRISTSNQTVPVGIWANGNYLYLSFTIFGQTRNFRRSTDGGNTWLNEITLPVIINDIAFLPSGIAHALSLKNDDHILWFYSTNNGANWSDTVNISGPETGTRAKPQICIDRLGDLHALWTSRQTGNVEVFYRFNSLGIEETGADRSPLEYQILYPNPATNTVRVLIPGGVELYNAAGIPVARLQSGENAINRLEPGIYFAKSRQPTVKFIKLAH